MNRRLLRPLALSAALSLAVALTGTVSAAAGDPSQWGLAATGDPSQWGLTATGDPSQWGLTAEPTLDQDGSQQLTRKVNEDEGQHLH
jgi:hypothetical protein